MEKTRVIHIKIDYNLQGITADEVLYRIQDLYPKAEESELPDKVNELQDRIDSLEEEIEDLRVELREIEDEQ